MRGEQGAASRVVARPHSITARFAVLLAGAAISLASLVAPTHTEGAAADPGDVVAQAMLPGGDDFARDVAVDQTGFAYVVHGPTKAEVTKWDVSGARPVANLTLSGAGNPVGVSIAGSSGYVVTLDPAPTLWLFHPATMQLDDSVTIPLSRQVTDPWGVKVMEQGNALYIVFSDDRTQIAAFDEATLAHVGTTALPVADGFAMDAQVAGSFLYLAMSPMDGTTPGSVVRLALPALSETGRIGLDPSEPNIGAMAVGSNRLFLPILGTDRVAVFDLVSFARIADVSTGRVGLYYVSATDGTHAYFIDSSSGTGILRFSIADGTNPETLPIPYATTPYLIGRVMAASITSSRLVGITGTSPTRIIDVNLSTFALSGVDDMNPGLSEPVDVITTESATWALGARWDSGYLARLDVDTLRVDDSFTLPRWRKPVAFAGEYYSQLVVVTQDPRVVYPNSSRVLLIDPGNGAVTSAIDIPNVSPGSKVARAGNYVYINGYDTSITVVDLLNSRVDEIFDLPDDVTSVDALSASWEGELLVATPEGLIRIDGATKLETARGQIPLDAGPAWIVLTYLGEPYLAAENGDVLRYGEESLDLLDRFSAPQGAGGYQAYALDGKNLILGDLAGGLSTLDLHVGEFQERVPVSESGIAGLTLDGQGHLLALAGLAPAQVWKVELPGKAPGDPEVVGYRWTSPTSLAIDVASYQGGLPFDTMRLAYGVDDTTLHQATSSGDKAVLSPINVGQRLTLELVTANAYGASRPRSWSLSPNSRTARVSMPVTANDVVLTSDFRQAYVAGGLIQVMRTFDDSIIGTLPVTGRVLALGSDDTTLLVGSESTTKVVDASTGGTLRTVGIGARLLAISPDGTRGYIATDDSVAVFNVATGSVINQVIVGSQVRGLEMSPDGQSLVVVTSLLNPYPSNNKLYVFDRDLNSQRELALPSFAISPVVSADSLTLYLAFPVQGVVRALALETLQTTQTMSGGSPDSLAMFDDGQKLAVNSFALGGSNYIIDIPSWQKVGITSGWNVNLNARGGAVTNDGGKVYIVSNDSRLPWETGQVLIQGRDTGRRSTWVSSSTSGSNTTFTWNAVQSDIPAAWYVVSVDGGSHVCDTSVTPQQTTASCTVAGLEPGAHTAYVIPGDSTGLWTPSGPLNFTVAAPSQPPGGGGGGGGGGSGGAPGPSPAPSASPSPSPSPPAPEPTPEPVVTPIPPGTGEVTVGGKPVEVTIQPNPTQGSLDINGPGFTLSLGGGAQAQDQGLIGPNGELSLRPTAPLGISGTGYAPRSSVGAYLQPMPAARSGAQRVPVPSWWAAAFTTVAATVTGTVNLGLTTVDDSGAFATSVTPPPATPTGEYVLQLVGASLENESRIMSVAVRVTNQESTKTLTIAGTRQKNGKRSYVAVSGASDGLVGRTVTPMFKLRGEGAYRQGSARILVQQDGSFTWQRRGGKKIYIYFVADGEAVRSNGLTIP